MIVFGYIYIYVCVCMCAEKGYGLKYSKSKKKRDRFSIAHRKKNMGKKYEKNYPANDNMETIVPTA